MQDDSMKIVIAILGLETHWKGAVTVAQMLREFGVEVVYIGNAFPEKIIEVGKLSFAGVRGLIATRPREHTAAGRQSARRERDLQRYCVRDVVRNHPEII